MSKLVDPRSQKRIQVNIRTTWNNLIKLSASKHSRLGVSLKSPFLISFIMIFYKSIYLIMVILRVSLLSAGVSASFKGRGEFLLFHIFFSYRNCHGWHRYRKNSFLVLRWGIFFFFFYRFPSALTNLCSIFSSEIVDFWARMPTTSWHYRHRSTTKEAIAAKKYEFIVRYKFTFVLAKH